jgi:hypothetical protein
VEDERKFPPQCASSIFERLQSVFSPGGLVTLRSAAASGTSLITLLAASTGRGLRAGLLEINPNVSDGQLEAIVVAPE